MPVPFASGQRPDARRHPRALVCTSALVVIDGEATEHLTYDLSAGGVRLCGVPHGRIGDSAGLLLQLPGNRIRASGRLVRFGSTDGRPDFAIEFSDLAPRHEDAIHGAVVEALAHSERRSILLLRREAASSWPGWGWLDPILPVCMTATTTLGAVQYLEQNPVELGILGPPGGGTQDSEWKETYEEVAWRTIDPLGRLDRLRRAPAS